MGAEKTVIFLPGFMCDDGLFSAQISACQNAGYQTITDDLSHSSTITGLAQNILKTAPEKFALVGLSLGGIVAMEIFRQAAERVSHLAMLNTTPHADKVQAQRKKQLARVANDELTLVLQEELKPNYLADCNRSADNLELLTEMGARLGKFVFASQCLALMTRQDSVDLLPKIDCPTLLVAGREDTVCPSAIHIEMAATIPDATLMILPNCGHLSTIECPEDVNVALLNLLGKSDKSSQKNSNKRAALRLVRG